MKIDTYIACVCLAGAFACGHGDGVSSSVQQPIVDGEASPSEEDGVLMLRTELDDGSEALCSASLVAPNLVLTARHCVSYLTPGLFSCNVRGELIENPEDGGRLGLHLPATSVEVYGRQLPRSEPIARGQQIISTLAETICVNDLALVVLDRSLDLPLIPLRLGRPAQLGESTTLVGYGLGAGQKSLSYRTQPRQRKTGISVAELGPDSLAEGVTTAPPRSLIIEGPSGCVGDSGGPLLAAESGAVLGVYSLQAGESCLQTDVRHQLVHVPPFRALLDEAFTAAAAKPTLEPEPEPSGEAGGAGAPAFAPPAGEDAGCAVRQDRTPRGPAWIWSLLLLAVCARRRAR